MADLISLGEVTPNNLGQLRKLNAVIFPVTYSDKFYSTVLEAPALARIGYYNDCAVGAVCVRKDVQPDKSVHLYIMTLGVLAPYRQLGVGKALLEHVMSLTQDVANVSAVYLHVQVGNDEALKFYRHHGFEVSETAKDYYKNVTPTDAHVLRKTITSST